MTKLDPTQSMTDSPALVPMEVDSIFDDRFLILELVGTGGMGSVYRVREIELDRIVALKILHPELVGDHEDMIRFKTEGRILSQLTCPNVIRFFRFGVTASRLPYLVVEYLKGLSLKDVISQSGPLPLDRALDISLQICSGLHVTHGLGIVHRDLKPSNVILVSADGREVAKILDFGLSRVLASSPVSITQHLTKTGFLIGSVNYMSPEQCLGRKVDARSDIYALGCLIYELLSGEQPFTADNPVGLLHKHVAEQAKPLRSFSVCSKIPDGVEAVLHHAMQKDPANRYQTVEEFRQDLEAVRSGRQPSVSDRPPAAKSGAKPLWMKNEAITAAVLVILLVAISGLFLFVIQMMTSLTAHPSGETVTSKQASQGVPDDVCGTVCYLSFDDSDGRLVAIHLKEQNARSVSKLPVSCPLYLKDAPLLTSECRCTLDGDGRVVAVVELGPGQELYHQSYAIVKSFLKLVSRKQWDKANLLFSDRSSTGNSNSTDDSAQKMYSALELKRSWGELSELSENRLDQILSRHSKIRGVEDMVEYGIVYIPEEALFKDRLGMLAFSVFAYTTTDNKLDWRIMRIRTNVPTSEWEK